jgi:hypothetical protein
MAAASTELITALNPVQPSGRRRAALPGRDRALALSGPVDKVYALVQLLFSDDELV